MCAWNFFHRPLITALLVVIFGGWSWNVSAGVCEAVLRHGIWAYDKTTSEKNRNNSFKNWLCSKSQSGSGSAENWGGNVGIKGFELGAKGGKKSWSDAQSELCNETDTTDDTSQKASNYARYASKVIAEAWRACTLNQFGLTGWIVHTENPRHFIVRFQHRPDSDENEVRIRDFIVRPKNVKCEPDMKKAENKKFTTQMQVLCERSKKLEAVTIIINANKTMRPIGGQLVIPSGRQTFMKLKKVSEKPRELPWSPVSPFGFKSVQEMRDLFRKLSEDGCPKSCLSGEKTSNGVKFKNNCKKSVTAIFIREYQGNQTSPPHMAGDGRMFTRVRIRPKNSVTVPKGDAANMRMFPLECR